MRKKWANERYSTWISLFGRAPLLQSALMIHVCGYRLRSISTTSRKNVLAACAMAVVSGGLRNPLNSELRGFSLIPPSSSPDPSPGLVRLNLGSLCAL
jgi:hypothetical protein